MDRIEDEQLMDDHLKGDEHALSELFGRHRKGVFNFALRLLNNRAQAEDITSEVFMKLAARQMNYTRDAKFRTWLFVLARNACFDHLRKRKRVTFLWFKNPSTGEVEEMDVQDSQPGVDEHMDRQQLKTVVQNAIARLPLDYRQALILREYHEMDYAQIAHVMECSHDNVKILIYRARQKLKDLLPPLTQEGLS